MSEKTCSKCWKELRSDNTKGICGDAAACAKRAGGAPAPAAKKAPPAGAKAKGERLRIRVIRGGVEELLARRDHLLAELDATDAAIREALAAKRAEIAKLEAAVQRAARPEAA